MLDLIEWERLRLGQAGIVRAAETNLCFKVFIGGCKCADFCFQAGDLALVMRLGKQLQAIRYFEAERSLQALFFSEQLRDYAFANVGTGFIEQVKQPACVSPLAGLERLCIETLVWVLPVKLHQ